jgi:hypothetical protein
MKILYVGNDLELLKYLQETLDVVRCPPGDTCDTCRSFITNIRYDLILLDESQQELIDFIRSVKVNKETPIVVYSGGEYGGVVCAIQERLTKSLVG